MANNEFTIPIPARLKNVAKGGHVAGADQIIDDALGKEQSVINKEVSEAIEGNTQAVAAERQRAEAAEGVLDNRLSDVEELAEISIDGGEAKIATGEDFHNPTAEQRAKIPTVGAVLNGADDEPTAGSQNLVKSGGVQNELALGAVYDVSAKNPTAGPNNDGKWESFSALLSDANLNTLIPTAVRKGGMSVKFIQSSDNKYVQYRLMADEYTTDTTQWAIADEGVYVENPEFVYVKTDREGKILWAIKADGGIYYGAGCPQQIINYIEGKIADLSLDEYEDIVTFLSDYLGSDTTLKVMIDEINATKVDKEEGKSLIDSEFAEGVHYIESPEFAEIKLDAEERIVEATYKDGTKLLPAGVKIGGVAEYDGATVTTVNNPEFVAIWLDSSNRILLGIRNDADIFFGYGVPSQIKDYIDANLPKSMQEIVTFIGDYLGSTTLQELLNKKIDGEYIDNPEYIEAKLDSNDKIIEATKEDGTKVLPAGVETPKIDVEGAIITASEDVEEKIEILKDSEDKIISYRDNDGVLHEEAGVNTSKLNMPNCGYQELSDSIKKASKNYQFGINISGRYEVPMLPAMTEQDISYYYDLYDSLMQRFPNYITKEDCDAEMATLGITRPSELEGLPIYLYKFIPPHTPYNSVITQTRTVCDILKVFITSGTHPEQVGIMDLYHTMRIICEEWENDDNIDALRWDVEFYIIPCSSPWNINNNSRPNYNGVDLNRNSPSSTWAFTGRGGMTFSGDSPGSEYESKVFVHYFHKISPAVYIDHHNCNINDNKNLIYIHAGTKEGLNIAGAHITDMTRRWKKRFNTVFPKDDVIYGYVDYETTSGSGTKLSYGSDYIDLAFTYESNDQISYKDGQYNPEERESYTSRVVTIATDGFLNFLLRLLKTFTLNINHY